MRLAIAKDIQTSWRYEIKRTKLNISMVMSTGDLEKSIFLHESINKPRSRTGSMCFIR